MKKILLYLKKHWFSYSSLFLIIVFCTSFCISAKIRADFYKKSIVKIDAETLEIINDDLVSEKMTEYQISTVYNYYESLGYNLKDEKYIKTRQQILGNIQDSYLSAKILKEFTDKNNISVDISNLQEIYKNSKSGKDDYLACLDYVNKLYANAYDYIIENKLFDIEKEITIIQETYKTNDENIINDLLRQRLKETISQIIAEDFMNQ